MTPDGQLIDLPVAPYEEPPSGPAMLEALRNLGEIGEQIARTAGHYLRESAGVAPISSWAWLIADVMAGVELEGRLSARSLPSGIGSISFEPEDGGPGCMAWHDECFAAIEVPPGLDRVLVTYDESRAARFDRQTAEWMLRARHDIPDAGIPEMVETELEWFGFFGENTIAVHGSDSMEGSRGTVGNVGLELETGGRQGAIAMRPWQWIGSPLRRQGRDPFFQNRLAHYYRLGSPPPELPDLTQLPSNALVWVHGALSCGLLSSRELEALTPRFEPVRYEHDTFVGINHNAQNLASLLADKARQRMDVTIVGHSRGGLVARMAARILSSIRPDLRVRVFTLGTPHLGTPIVNAAHRALRAFVGLTSFGLSSAPDPGSLLLKYLLRFTRLPVGIEDMAVDSDFLRGFQTPEIAFDLISIGANFENGAMPQSAGVQALGRLRRLFAATGDDENDLVVSVRSAKGAGDGLKIDESCGHFEYLSRSEVRDLIKERF